jgi:hypothetical protein
VQALQEPIRHAAIVKRARQLRPGERSSPSG